MLGDLKNPKLIYAKGLLFLILGVFASTVLIVLTRNWQVAILLAIAIWSFCRFYYFAFYVIEHYIDDGFRYAGLSSFLRHMINRKTPAMAADSQQQSDHSNRDLANPRNHP